MAGPSNLFAPRVSQRDVYDRFVSALNQEVRRSDTSAAIQLGVPTQFTADMIVDFDEARTRLRTSNRSYLERMFQETVLVLNSYMASFNNFRGPVYYQQFWRSIAADWRRSAVGDNTRGVTFATTVYLPLRRAVRGFVRRWRARNQWRLNIPGIPVAARVWDTNNPRIGRRPQGGESGLY